MLTAVQTLELQKHILKGEKKSDIDLPHHDFRGTKIFWMTNHQESRVTQIYCLEQCAGKCQNQIRGGKGEKAKKKPSQSNDARCGASRNLLITLQLADFVDGIVKSNLQIYRVILSEISFGQ